jgi:hypothetical protein
MPLRDHFAIQALRSILANHTLLIKIDSEFSESTRKAAALYAYGLADAMLKVRDGE